MINRDYPSLIALAFLGLVFSACATSKPPRESAGPTAPPVKVAYLTDVVLMRDMRGGPDLFDVKENLDTVDLLHTILSYHLEKRGYVVVSSECAGFGVSFATAPGIALLRNNGKTEKGLLPVWNEGFRDSARQAAFTETVNQLRVGHFFLTSSSWTVSASGSTDTFKVSTPSMKFTSLDELQRAMLEAVKTAQAAPPPLTNISTATLSRLEPGEADVLVIVTSRYKGPTVLRSVLTTSAQMAFMIPMSIAGIPPTTNFGIPADGYLELHLVDRKTGRILAYETETSAEGGASASANFGRMARKLAERIPKAN